MLMTPNQAKNHCQRLILHQPFEETVLNSILFTAVPKPEIDFVREIVTEWAGETDGDWKNLMDMFQAHSKIP